MGSSRNQILLFTIHYPYIKHAELFKSSAKNFYFEIRESFRLIDLPLANYYSVNNNNKFRFFTFI